MLSVNYKKEMGTFTLLEKRGGKDVKFKIHIYACNALAALIYHYTDENGEPCSMLFSFYADEEHMKNILLNEGDVLFHTRIRDLKLNTYYKETETLLKYFKLNHKVKTYYKEPNE